MPIVNVLGSNKKREVMFDTWGHLYPEPGSKHPCKILVMHHDRLTTVLDRKHDLEYSPIEFELVCTVIDKFDWVDGLQEVDCVLWFFKTSNAMFLGGDIGRIIKAKVKTLYSTDGWADAPHGAELLRS